VSRYLRSDRSLAANTETMCSADKDYGKFRPFGVSTTWCHAHVSENHGTVISREVVVVTGEVDVANTTRGHAWG
jgi:hypothetical protein